jgi:hypothetical protein
MLKDLIMATEEEKREAEIWVLQTCGPDEIPPVDILMLILYWIHLLEEKITRIDQQTRTHWVR